MKKVLITGANSYIGTSFERWVQKNCFEIEIDTLDMQGDEWKEFDFSGYDSVFHVAGIAHADVGKVTDEERDLYYKVNTELTVTCATKAKEEGVKQFIFMSSIIVYGESAGIGKKRVVTKDTPLTPANFYGDSKVQAENGLQELADNYFSVVVLRPPMIYGKNSRGNYPLLAKMAKKMPLFPRVENERSMLYIGNLCKFISLMILNEESGVFFPQNREYVQTSQMVKLIAKAHKKEIRLTNLFNPFLMLLGKTGGKLGGLVNKAFGNLVYEKELSQYRENYWVCDLDVSVKETEYKE